MLHSLSVTDALSIVPENATTMASSLNEDEYNGHVTTAVDYIYTVLLLALSAWMTLGNSLTLAAVFKFRTLRTPTNAFVCCLATADLVVAFGLPLQILMLYRWHTSEWYGSCMVSILLYFYPTSISVHFLQGISFDRFIAIHYPLRYTQLMTMNRVAVICILIAAWDTFILVIPILSWNKWEYGTTCQIENVMEPLFSQLAVIALLYLSLTSMIILYGITLNTALKQQRRIAVERAAVISFTRDQARNTARKSSEIKAAVGLAIVVGAFAFCFIPYSLVLLVSTVSTVNLPWIRMICNFMALCNSGMNPIIYGLKVPQFRRAFRRMGLRCSCMMTKDEDDLSTSRSM